MDDSIDELSKLFELADTLTPGQWNDLHHKVSMTGEHLLWLHVLKLAVLDWRKLRSHPQSLLAWQNAKDLPDWFRFENLSAQLVSQALEDLCKLNSDKLREDFIKFLGPEPHNLLSVGKPIRR